MPGFNPEKINIHDLTIEEPERESGEIFDLERDFTADDRQMLHDKLSELRTEKKSFQAFEGNKHYLNWINFAKIASDMVVTGENPKLTEDDFIQLKSELEFRRQYCDWTTFTKLAADLKNLGQEPNVTNNDWSNIEKVFNLWRGTPSIDEDVAVSMAILGKTPEFSKDDSRHMKSGAGIARMDQNTVQAARWGRVLAVNLAQFRILGLDYELSADDWKQMKMSLDWMRGLDAKTVDKDYFIDAIFAMTVLAAEKVKITDKGLEITMPNKKNFQTETPQMPEQKQF